MDRVQDRQLGRSNAAQLLESFVRANRRLCHRVTPRHYWESNVFAMYTKVATMLVAQPDVRRVLDSGAGKLWRLPASYKQRFGLYLIGIDIALEEMAANDLLDEKLEGDVCRAIPVAPGSVDLITAFSGIEHFADNEAFLGHCYGALRPGGLLLAQFPGRYAPFALLNQALPERLSSVLLRNLLPGSEGVLGFKAYYDRTHYSAFRGLAEAAGFEVEYHLAGYFGSEYFAFFAPLYAAATLVDLFRFGLGVKDLASYNLFVLRKPGPGGEIVFA